LRSYDAVKKEGHFTVADLNEGELFETEKGKTFQRGKIRRKRIECLEVKTGLLYIFSPITLVKKIE
jgi:hypothetical protein